MTDQPAVDDHHTCKPGARHYFCPASGDIESDCHGGHTHCCDQPDQHQPVLKCNHAHLRHPHLAHGWEPQPGMDPVHCPGHPFTAENRQRVQEVDEPDLTVDEARDLVSDLSVDLYWAQDRLGFVGECCDIADREQRPITTADVREWLKGARCGRQLAADTAAPDAAEPEPWSQLEAHAFNAVQPALKDAGEWLRLSSRRAVAKAVLAAVQPHLAAHYQRAVDAALAAERRAHQAEAKLARIQHLVDAHPVALDPALIAEALDDPPAHNAGPSVAEAAANDRRWWGGEKAGE
ncbi:hypothetical protein ABZX82_01870 [Streptomyces griseoflavus]|uniref:hypothetical protein n=1 Tax=Streptomyces griseoflavus TaxID=35619 RepID=UPI0033B33558